MTDIVDRITDGIRDCLLACAPNLPTYGEYQSIVSRVVDAYGYVIVRQGYDVDHKPFIQVQPGGGQR